MLQGVSKGAIIAEKTSKYLSKELQENTQRLLDNPVGDHEQSSIRWLKGMELAAGFTAETLARMFLDDTAKALMKQSGAFVDYLSRVKAIEKDDGEQTKLKWRAAIAEVTTLIKGSSLDTEETRSFIRRAMYDPITFSPMRILEIRKKSREGKKVQFFQEGKSVEAPFKGHHMFFYNRYHRWSTILDFARKAGPGELDRS